MNEIDVSACDREPIHIPGAIQPHGLMLVVDPGRMVVTHAAGDVAERLGRADWQGAELAELLGGSAGRELVALAQREPRGLVRQVAPPFSADLFDCTFHVAGPHLVIELEPALGLATAAALLPQLEAAAAALERSATIGEICRTAAIEFRQLSGFDRVMIYRFLEDDAGVVLAEDAAQGQHSFLNHHFPATDIPRQARALYVRNLVRVIPDVAYTPAQLVPEWSDPEPLDMSDSALRSVSPIHVQYLKNMGVAASASISIVKDGVLWGLVACHHSETRHIPADVRAACRALAGTLARQIRAREETDGYRERVRLRTYEDIVALLSREGSLDTAISNHLGEIMRMLDADGVAVMRGNDVVIGGSCPPEARVRSIARWALDRADNSVFATARLGEALGDQKDHPAAAAGLLAITLSRSEPWIVLWFRAEAMEVINWAGNPHKNVETGPSGQLSPRRSFEAWSETVRGRARRWTIAEIEAAGRLRTAVINVWQNRRIRELNRQLLDTLEQKETLIRQREFLLGEVNHRVQNSLQLVSSFLQLQGKASDDEKLKRAIEEARRRIAAVSLVHRRLYSAEQLETIDAARYVEELLNDLVSSMGADWAGRLVLDLQPVMLPNDRAVGIGLVLTELVINANKYAYGGAAGPLRVTLAEDRNRLRLVVADDGGGRTNGHKGFGSRMMEALVAQLEGELTYEDNMPGTRAILSAPIDLGGRTQ